MSIPALNSDIPLLTGVPPFGFLRNMNTDRYTRTSPRHNSRILQDIIPHLVITGRHTPTQSVLHALSTPQPKVNAVITPISFFSHFPLTLSAAFSLSLASSSLLLASHPSLIPPPPPPLSFIPLSLRRLFSHTFCFPLLPRGGGGHCGTRAARQLARKRCGLIPGASVIITAA